MNQDGAASAQNRRSFPASISVGADIFLRRPRHLRCVLSVNGRFSSVGVSVRLTVADRPSTARVAIPYVFRTAVHSQNLRLTHRSKTNFVGAFVAGARLLKCVLSVNTRFPFANASASVKILGRENRTRPAVHFAERNAARQR